MKEGRFYRLCAQMDVGERIFFPGDHVALMRHAHGVANRYGYKLATRRIAFVDMKTGESEIGVRVERIQ